MVVFLPTMRRAKNSPNEQVAEALKIELLESRFQLLQEE
jgi:hypothetical protein